MGNNLRPTGKSLTCPICGDHSGKCRISQDKNLVLCLASAGDDWQVSGFKSLGASKCGTWQQYRRCDENYDPEIAQRRRDEWQSRERERIASLPSLASRASKINHNLSRGLNQAHLAKLIERGLSREQIAHHGFYSFQGGIAGVVRGLDREPITVAYRLDNPDGGGRYRWGKDSQLPGSGDLPVSVNYPHSGSYSREILYLCEGSIIKPAIASERLQGIVIGFGGGSGNLDRIKPQLLEICAHLEPKEIRILPDAGYRKNSQVSRAIDSLIAICEPLAATSLGDWGQADDKVVGDIDEITEDRLKSVKYCLCTASDPVNDESSTGNTQTRLTALVTTANVTNETPFDRVIHLPRITKESLKTLELADITDLMIDVGGDLIADEIKWAIKGNGLEFHCKKHGGNLRISYSGMTMFFSEYETLCKGQKFTANYRFSLTETDRYLPQDKILEKLNPGQTKLIGIKAPQAAGKTEVSEKIIKVHQHHYTEKTGKFLPVYSISLRVTLAEGNSKRLNIPHIDLIVQQGLDWASQGFSNVADSLYMNPKAKKAIFDIDKVDGNCILFLDEVVQLFDHMLFSSTMKKQRVQVLQNFTELLSKVYNSEYGVVIGLDADLNDTTIQTLSKLMSSGEKADLGLECLTFKALNKWSKPKRTIHLTEKPEELMRILLENCETLEKGEKLLVGTASQQLKSTFSAHWIAQKISEESPDLKVLVLDSATTKNPDSKAFGGVGKINQMIIENDIIIYTPVLSTGVSIDALPIIESVKSVFSFGSQAINPQTQRQSLERLRSYCDVFAFAPKTITPRILNGGTNAWSINQHIIEQNKLNEHEAGISEYSKKQKELARGIIKACRTADKKHAEFGEGSPWMEIFSEYAAYKNLSQKHYQQLFINALKADGYAVKYLEVEGAKALKKEMEAMKEAGLADKYQRIPSDSVECLDLEKYNDLKDAKQLTQADQDALEKFQVSRTYYLEPHELTKTLLREHDEYGSAGALTWCYARSLYLGAGHVVKKRDQRKRAQRTERDGVVFLPDSNRELVSAKTSILHEIDLLGFIDRTKDEQIHKNHPEVLSLMDRLKARLKRFNTALGKRYSVKTLSDPIRVIRELLKAVQHQIVSGVRTMIEGEQTRCYSIEQLGTINLRELYMRWAWFECEAQVKHEAYIESLEMAQEFENHVVAFTVDNSPHKVVFRYPA